MDKLEDNILQSEPAPAAHVDADQAADNYMKRFENIDIQCGRLRDIASALKKQPDQDHRLMKVINFVEQQQKWNDDIYDLLVEMNNFFAPK